MTWSSALKKQAESFFDAPEFSRPDIPQHKVDWPRLVSLDFETYYDQDYTLSKLSTSEYIRDKRFKAQMLGLKIGNGKTKIVAAKNIRAELAKINWSTHAVLCHNTQFDGFILSHHYGVHPAYLYDTLSMARGLHSNDIGAGLDEVSIFYGGHGKLEGLEATKGVLNWSPALFKSTGVYCANDVDEMFRVFKLMLPKMPADEMDLIDLTCRMFCSPVLKVDIPRVEKELERELARRELLMYGAVDPAKWEDAKLLKGPAERALEGKERDMLIIKRVIGSNEKFADLLRAEGVEPPLKISPAWMKKNTEQREACIDDKYAYAFAKDDAKFIELPNMVDDWGFDLNKPEDVKLMVAKQERLQALVDVRIATKSTTNITRAQRFLTAGADGMSLPVGYAYARAHTLRWGGQNKMNMQALIRGGELRLSILAPKGHMIAVQDSGQIECVARDSLVLTRDRGYIAIQHILLSDQLWDGVEWVHHDGVVCTGYKEVITYDGVTATRDHKVWRQDGTSCTLEEAQKPENGQGLAVGGLCGQAVRFLDRSERADGADGSCESPVPLRQMLGGVRRGVAGLAEWQIDSVQKLRRQAVEKLRRAGAAIRRHMAKVQRPHTPQLRALRSQGHQTVLCVPQGIYPMDGGVPPTSGLPRRGDRQGEQLGALSARQSSFGDAPPERKQPEYDLQGDVRRPVGAKDGVHGTEPRMRVWVRHSWQLIKAWAHRRADHPPVQNSVQKAFVYDILNAGPRHRFTASDRIVSNCRVNGWLWGQHDLMDAFRAADAGTGRDAYCNFGDHVYGREITKDDKMERFVGKVCVLGLGFQMGAPKFQLTLAKGALGGPPVFFELDRCKMIVNTYRSKNHKIVAGWEICKGIIEDMAAGRTGSHGPIDWEFETIWMPNGMCLKYPDLRKSKNDKGWDEWSYQAKDQRKKLYGGLLCENLVQCLARIVVAQQMLQISRKYRVVMTTHDEVVAIAKTAQAQKCLDFMAKSMSTPLPWCLDLPLNCEGGFAENYSK